LLSGKVISEREETPTMLKYASKFLLNIFLSVLATVIGSYLANQYIAGRPVADPPVSLAGATIDPKRPDANAAPREAVKAGITVSEGPLDVANAIGPAAIGGRSIDRTNNEKAAPPVDKLAESTNVHARQHRSAPRYKQISKTSTIAAPENASLTVASPEPGRATTGQIFGTNANSALDASLPPQQVTGRDDDVLPLLDSEMAGSHLTRRVLKPIIRTIVAFRAAFVARPCSRTATAHVAGYEILSSSRVLRFSCSRIAAVSLLMTSIAAN
jgi:hypothetical protein